MTSPLEQKLKVKGPVVVTANRTRDGIVIYRTAHSGWTTDLAEAAIVTTTPAAQELLKGAVADDVGAVQAYVAPVELTADRGVLPGNLRERIRVSGPTIELPAVADVSTALPAAADASNVLPAAADASNVLVAGA